MDSIKKKMNKIKSIKIRLKLRILKPIVGMAYLFDLKQAFIDVTHYLTVFQVTEINNKTHQ